MEVTVGISNRHVHVTKEVLEQLFGVGYQLESLRPLKQPGQFASVEQVTIQTLKNKIEHVRILGPIRSYTQVEISKTDAMRLGLEPPVRESGDIKGSSPITIIGPKGTVSLEEGAIIASRHIHITPQQVKEFGLEGVEKVNVVVQSFKGGVLSHVSLKVSDNAYYELHLDTDDANAFLLQNGDKVTIQVADETSI